MQPKKVNFKRAQLDSPPVSPTLQSNPDIESKRVHFRDPSVSPEQRQIPVRHLRSVRLSSSSSSPLVQTTFIPVSQPKNPQPPKQIPQPRNITMASQPQNFQPQVRNTTDGPNMHTYIPRADGTFVVGGVPFAPQAGIATAPVAPVAVTGVPTPAQHPVPPPPAPYMPAAIQYQPYLILPGGPAVPAYGVPPVQLTPQHYPFACHYIPMGGSAQGYTAAPFVFPYAPAAPLASVPIRLPASAIISK